MATGLSSSSGAASVDLLLLLYYYPSLAAAVVAGVLFFLITIPLAVLAVRTGLRLSWILVVTSLAEAVGYALRAVISQHPALIPFVVSELPILLAPNALALLNYKVLGQLIQVMSPPAGAEMQPPSCRLPFLMDERGLIRGRRVAWIFFISDVIGFLVQGAGGGEEASTDPGTQRLGNHVVLGGLAFQVVFFFLFAVLAVYVYYSPLYNRPQQQCELKDRQQALEPEQLRRVFSGLFVTIALILVRNVYRLVEFGVAVGSYIPSHEWLFYMFDTLVMFTALLVYTRWHFGLSLPNTQAAGVANETAAAGRDRIAVSVSQDAGLWRHLPLDIYVQYSHFLSWSQLF